VSHDVRGSALSHWDESVGQTHLWFLENMDRVNRAIQGTHDLDRLMHDVLDVVLDVFGCDRAWLAYPCDPDAPSWRAMMERTRPEYPGAGSGGPEMPMDPDTAFVVRRMREADGPVTFGLPPSPPVPEDFPARFGIRAVMGMALHPRVGEPWSFGLHQCSHARVWTGPEVELFREIGRRLADAVTTLLAFRTLHEESERLRLAVQASSVGLWDWNIVTSEAMYSREYKQQLGYEDHELSSDQVEWATRVHPDDLAPSQQDLQAFLDGTETQHAREYRMRHRDGSWHWFYVRGELRRDERGKPLRMLGCHLDITDRKRADEERQANVWFLESMDRVNRAIQGASDLDQLMGDVLEASLATFNCDRVFLVHPCDPKAPAWSLVAERTRPEYRSPAGAYRSVPMTAEDVGIVRMLRAADGPVSLGPGCDNPIPPTESRFGVMSALLMAVYPHADQPYAFGLHQCSYARVWTRDEMRLLQEIGRRLADGLTSRFVLHSLRTSEGRLAEAQRVAHVGHWDRDLVTGLVTLSSEAMRILGISHVQRDPGGFEAQWRAIVRPDDQERVSAALAEALRGGARYDVEYRVIHPDGQVRVVHSQGDVTRSDTGRPRRIFGTMQDITDFRRAEAELRGSEGRFRTFVDHATDAFFLHEWNGTILDVNRQACDSLGYTRDELVGMSPAAIDVDTDFRKLIASQLESGDVVAFDSRHRRKDGSTFPVEVRLRPFTQEGRRFAVALVRDITQRKAAERAVIESHSLLDAVVEGTSGAVFVKDLDGRYVMINSAGAHLFGLTVEEVLGRGDHDLFPPDMADEIVTHDRQVLTSGTEHTIEEARTMGGVTRTYLTTRGVYRDAQDQVIGLVGFSRDITDLKRLEQQFRQAQKMEAVGQLAGGVAHDFNNLLTAIIGFGEMAFNSLDPDDPNRELITEIRRAGQRAANLTRQLLAFSRKQVLRPEVVSLNTLLGDVMKLLQRLIGEDIEVSLSPDEALGLAKIDPGQFEQAVINLAVNARDAMPHGGSLLIETTNVELDAGYASLHEDVAAGSYVMVAVSDSGLGMDETTRAHIFEPFFTTKPTGEGTGLGLAMVYGFVKQSGGHVEAYSEPGRGTTFKVFLPRVFDTVVTPPADDTTTMPKGHETVLLVEDEEAVRTLAGRVLQSAGYTVLSARNGPEAIRLADEHQETIHLLATDLVMPRMSGLEVASQLTQTRPGIRILLMSGYPNEAAMRHGVPPGASLLQKPFNAVGLARAVRQVLDAS